ncbi:MAG TPA: hypothetical protein VIT44_18065 [Cyclobacteriaceae bacterium]
MTKKIVIPYFPKGMKYSTPLIFGLAVFLSIKGLIVIGALLVLFIILILTSNYVTEISMEQKRYWDYLSMMGIKLNVETTSFTYLDRIIVTKENVAKRVTSRLQSRTMQWTSYTATLLFDHQKTLDLITLSDKRELMEGLQAFAAFLQVPIEDRTISVSRNS